LLLKQFFLTLASCPSSTSVGAPSLRDPLGLPHPPTVSFPASPTLCRLPALVAQRSRVVCRLSSIVRLLPARSPFRQTTLSPISYSSRNVASSRHRRHHVMVNFGSVPRHRARLAKESFIAKLHQPEPKIATSPGKSSQKRHSQVAPKLHQSCTKVAPNLHQTRRSVHCLLTTDHCPLTTDH
jgi:hypothetical protein